MAFLDESVESSTSCMMGLDTHPVLLGEEMALSDRVLYLKGIALAALLDDAEISLGESNVIKRIGTSLKLTDDIIEESFEIKNELSGNPALQNEFLQEMYRSLNTDLRKRSFIADVERLFFVNGQLKSGVEKYYRKLGVNLFGPSWEAEFDAKQFAQKHPVAGKVASGAGKAAGYLANTNLGFLVRKIFKKS